MTEIKYGHPPDCADGLAVTTKAYMLLKTKLISFVWFASTVMVCVDAVKSLLSRP